MRVSLSIMKITFTIPFSYLTGGIRSIFELSNALTKRGHKICVVVPKQPFPMGNTWMGKAKRRFLELTDNLIRLITSRKYYHLHVDWFKTEFDLIQVRHLSDFYLPDSNVVVATNWKTASWVNALVPQKGEKFYLVFDYETWDKGSHQVTAVESTYQLPMNIITYSDFVKTQIRTFAKRSISAKFTLGYNADIFYSDEAHHKSDKLVRVCMLMHDLPHKGLKTGLEAFQRVKEQYPNVQLAGFGSKKVKELLPDWVEFHSRPSDEELRKLYSSCHIFISTSHHEGFNLPPMEAMACGCAVVSTKVGAVSEYSEDGETVLLCEPGNAIDLSEKLLKLVTSSEERVRIARNASKHIKKYSWDYAAQTFEQALNTQSCQEKHSVNVSVIIPTYNRPEKLSNAIRSVKSQTFSNYEILVVHNGPFETAEAVVESFKSQGINIKYFHAEKTGGANARNVGIQNTVGEMIAFLDDDDEWLPNKLEDQIKLISSDPSIGLVYSEPVLCSKDGSEKPEYVHFMGDPSFKELVEKGCLIRSLSGVLARRECFEKLGVFNTRYQIGNDFEFYLRVAKNYRIAKTKQPLYRYYFHGSNLSGNLHLGFEEFIQALRLLQPAPELGVTYETIKSAIKVYHRNYCGAAVDAMQDKRYWKAFRCYCWGLRHEPLIGLRIQWGRFDNPVYRALRPYCAAGYCLLMALKSIFNPLRAVTQ